MGNLTYADYRSRLRSMPKPEMDIPRFRREVYDIRDIEGDRTAVQLGRLVQKFMNRAEAVSSQAFRGIETFLRASLCRDLDIRDNRAEGEYLLLGVISPGGEQVILGLGQYRELRKTMI